MRAALSFQTLLFGYFIIWGILVGVVYDLFYGMRKVLRLKIFGTAICDFTFFVLFLSSFFLLVINISNGENLGYLILGGVLGTIFYKLTFSVLFKTIFHHIMELRFKLKIFYRKK